MLSGQANCRAVSGAGDDIGSETPWTLGDRTSHRTIVLVGDYEAYMWIAAFVDWGRQYPGKVAGLVQLGCDPWESATYLAQCAQCVQSHVGRYSGAAGLHTDASGRSTVHLEGALRIW
jgi:hypothetical protein